MCFDCLQEVGSKSTPIVQQQRVRLPARSQPRMQILFVRHCQTYYLQTSLFLSSKFVRRGRAYGLNLNEVLLCPLSEFEVMRALISSGDGVSSSTQGFFPSYRNLMAAHKPPLIDTGIKILRVL